MCVMRWYWTGPVQVPDFQPVVVAVSPQYVGAVSSDHRIYVVVPRPRLTAAKAYASGRRDRNASYSSASTNVVRPSLRVAILFSRMSPSM